MKSAVLETVKRRNGISSELLSKVLLNFLRIGFNPSPSSMLQYGKEARAAAVISIDFDHLTKSLQPGSTRWFPKKVEALLGKNRQGTRHMLELSEKYNIPMTWAICGQTAEEDPGSYEAIRRSKMYQEIGVHTYSHADVASCTAQELEDEVKKCLKVLDLQEHPKTFIFPWNRTGHFELLSKMGFLVYRGKARSIGTPVRTESLLNIPPTYYLDTKSYKAHSLMQKFLDVCISWNSVFHLWLHPWSVVVDDSSQFVQDTLDPLLSYIKQKRDEGVLATYTMGELATFWKNSTRNT